MKKSHSKRGFTLIELLIVVAIIAILAAIAVPNFLEAQTRAKISRVKSDFRALTVGIEAYMVDNNTYINAGSLSRTLPTYQGSWQRLTTPIAYMTSIPFDPFGFMRHPTSNAFRFNQYELGAGRVGINGNRGGWGSPPGPNGIRDFLLAHGAINAYTMQSDGPDKIDINLSMGGDNGYPGWVMDDWDGTFNEVYDSTNGSKSKGQICRSGGTKPPGIALGLYFQASTN